VTKILFRILWVGRPILLEHPYWRHIREFKMFGRYLGITKIGGSGLKVGVAAAVIVYIWAHNVSFNIPIIIWTTVHVNPWTGGAACYPRPDEKYLLATRIINFYLPLLITWVSYIGIICKLMISMHKAVLLHF